MDDAADQPILAIDLGGTRIRSAYVSPALDVVCRRAVDTRDEDGVDAVVERIRRLAADALSDARDLRLPDPVGVGISSPGPLDPWRGVVIAPPNLAGWRDVPLATAVEQALRLPTFLERDTNVAVMAEWRHGAARGTATAIYVTVSTGIGGGIVVDGRPLIGIDGTAGEVGHLTVELDGPACGDGSPGHAEAIGSGTAIGRQGRAALASGDAPVLAELAERAAAEAPSGAAAADVVDAALVARAADEGDEACSAILARAWTAVGAMCAGLVNVFNPEVLVMGGAIAVHRPELMEVVREEIGRRAFAIPARRVRVERAEHGDDVSLLGSLPIVNRRLADPAYGRGRLAPSEPDMRSPV
ncbi:MAG TPA: ROK family protein [Candidatus Limnocylindria bacterium]|nr:ROK family protein [Candidatus Limnocylindria bacterium]